jgi:hypothetical protein
MYLLHDIFEWRAQVAPDAEVQRVQVWPQPAEVGDRTLMRDGTWVV